MNIQIIELTQGSAKIHGNIYHNHDNQLRRAVGTFTYIYRTSEGGTVRDQDGKCWDWWPTDEVIEGTNFTRIKIVPAT